MSDVKESCFKCGGDIDVEGNEFDFDLKQMDYFHQKCEHKEKCDYCDEYVKRRRNTPYMNDAVIGSMMCEGCWDMTRSQFIGSEGIDIGSFDLSK